MAPGSGNQESMTVFESTSMSMSSGGSLPRIGPPGATDVAASLMRTASHSSGDDLVTKAGPPAAGGAAVAVDVEPPAAPNAGTVEEESMSTFIKTAATAVTECADNDPLHSTVASVIEAAIATTPAASPT